MKSKNNFIKDIVRLTKRNKFLKCSSDLERDYQEAFISLVNIGEDILKNGICNKQFANFIIEESKTLREIGQRYKGKI